ncbi:MAG: hypothetical protein A2096_07750 [Spirochaetes bacterium GWF1_41_5]|nr:MAG: hypothetical protein A2096_07750 [Spirochaetes bacterium GWF1_41_5]HBE02991.1 hypothetical protein [Spirochaetia bacterium]
MQIEKTNDTVLFRPGGELSLENISQVKSEILKQIEGFTRIIIDMKHLDYIDSSAIGMLVVLHKKFSAENKIFMLIDVPETVFEILRLGHMDKLFTIR